MQYGRNLFFIFLVLLLHIIPFLLPAQNTQNLSSSALQGFIENKGQMADYNGQLLNTVLFRATQPGAHIYITEKGISYFLFQKEEDEDKQEKRKDNLEVEKYKWNRIDMILENASIKKENIITEQPYTSTFNFYLAHCKDGVMEVRSYQKITIKNVYPGIDWVLDLTPSPSPTGEGGTSSFKYDFIVHPGTDPKQIKLFYEGVGKFQQSDKISVTTRTGKLIEKELFSYQDNSKNNIPTFYKVDSYQQNVLRSTFKAHVSYQIDHYDQTQMLVIDPPVQLYQWGTYFGGNVLDGIIDLKVNQTNDNFYVTGYTNSNLNFPLNSTGGTFYQGTTPDNGGDSFIARFDQNDALQWCTYFGGTGIDAAYALSIASDNSVYVTGGCNGGMPVASGGSGYFDNTNNGQDAFIFRFSSAGGKMWGTYFGGGPNQDWGKDITVDNSGNVIVVGISGSFNGFPLVNGGGYFDNTQSGTFAMFIARFDASYNLNWSTYYSGNNADGAESVVTDAAGNIYVGGWSNSSDLNTQSLAGAYNDNSNALGFSNGAQGQGDAVLLKFDNATNLQWATFYGGTGNDAIIDMAFSSSGNLYATGWTNSSDFPTQILAGAFNQTTYGGGTGGVGATMGGDAFVLKLSSTMAVQWATYFGGAGDEIQVVSSYGDGNPSIICDASGNTYIAGMSAIFGTIPLVNPGSGALYDNSLGGTDIYLAQFDNKDTLVWSTYIGGMFSSSAGDNDFARSLAVNSKGCLYLAGEWWSLDAPSKTETGAYFQGNGNGSDESCIMKFCPNITPLSLTVKDVDSKCYQSNNGTATANPTGGSPGYTYSWASGGQTTQTVTGLAPGIYTVTITDLASITSTATVEITEPAQLQATYFGSNSTCKQANGSAEVTSNTGGTSPYTYSWTSPSSTAISISNIMAGTYTVTVTDKNGCSVTLNVPVGNVGVEIQTTSSTPSSCSTNDGTATVTLVTNSAVSTPTYTWTTGGQTTSTATGLSQGIYTITVTDAFCTTTQTVAVTNTGSGTASISNITSISCNGLSDGTATANITGGQTPYTYSWSNGITQTTVTASGLSPGTTYTVTITDANNCKSTTTVLLTEPTAIKATTSSTPSNCGQATGTATVNPSGGNSGYTYSWNTTIQTTQTATGFAAGTYTVTIKDSKNCTATVSVTITNPNGPQLSPMFGIINCGGTSTGWAQADVINPSGTYTYSWTTINQTTAYVSNLTAGTYTATVTDANQCSSTIPITVAENPPIVLSATSTDASCGSNNGTATANASGGVNTLSYSWSTTATTANISNLIAGTYTVWVTDNVGCSKSSTVIISSSALNTSVNSTPVNCPGKNDGTATATVNTGSSPYTYSWSNNETTASISNISGGTYTVTITDKNNCTSTQTIFVNTNSGPIAYAGLDSTITSGTSIQLAGSGGGTYNWSPPTGLSCTACQNPMASPSETTEYILTVTDNAGCTDMDTIKIFIENICGELFIPTAFSPNGDGINDIFRIRGKCIKKFTLNIYDRWGEKLFETNDPTIGWDGTYKGKALDPAVFVFYIDADFTNNENLNKKGNVTLVK